MKRILTRISKIFLWIILFVIILTAGLVIALQIPSVQNYITQKAIHYVSDKTHSLVTLGEINIAFPKSLVLNDLFFEDQKHDSLFYAHRISVDIDMMKLMSHAIEVNGVEVSGMTAHITRSLPDSCFNFDFITSAFGMNDTLKKEIPDSSAAPWKFSIEKIQLDKIFLTFEDQAGGSEVRFTVGNFETVFTDFDLDKNRFHIKNIELDNTTAFIVQTKISAPTDTASPFLYDVDVKNINLSSVRFFFQTPQQKMDLNIGKANVSADKINLLSQEVSLKNISVADSRVALAISRTISPDTVVQKAGNAVTDQQPASAVTPWKVTLANLTLKNNSAVFDNFNSTPAKEGIDFNHLLLTGIEADIKKIRYDGKSMSADIREMKAVEQSGIAINHFQAEVNYDSVHAEVANVDLQTPESHISTYVSLSYPSLESVADSIGNLAVKMNLDHSVIGLDDVLLFQPALAAQINQSGIRARSVEITASVNGKVNDLHIPDLELKAGGNTYLVLNGNVKGLPEIERSYFDIRLRDFSTSAADIHALLNPRMLPQNISIPASLKVIGSFRGYFNQFNGNAAVSSSFGNITADVLMKGSEQYVASAETDHLDLGKLLRQPDTFGPVTMKANITGSGFSPKTMKGKVDAFIQQAVLKDYDYHNISIKGNFTGKQFDGTASVEDSNLMLAFNGLLNFEPGHASYQATLNIDGADLQALHLTTEDLRVKGLLTADIKGDDLNDINGTLDLRNVAITKNDTIYTIDSVLFASISDSGSKSIDIHSPFLTASFKGNIGIADLPAALQEQLDRYMNLSDTAVKPMKESQNFTFNIDFRNSDLYPVIIPGLKKFSSGNISGAFNSAVHSLDLNVNIPQLQYQSFLIDSIHVNVSSDAQKLKYNMALASASNGNYRLLNTMLKGKLENDSAGIYLTIRDSKNELKYLLAGNLRKENQDWRFSIIPDSIILNYNPWSVSPDNFLLFGKNGLYANDVALSNGNQLLKINSVGAFEAQSPLEFTFNDFNLASIASIIQSQNILASGLMNGTVVLKNLQSAPAFNADMTITDFSFNGDTLGTIMLTANNATANQYNAEISIHGNGNDISAKGFYNATDKETALNFDVALTNVNLPTLEAYTFGQVTQMKGSLKGDLKISGSTTTPDINGSLKFSDAGFNLSYVNSYYELKNEDLIFQNSKLTFPNFRITDSEGNAAVVNGWIEPDAKQLFIFNLTAETKNFLAINSSRKDTGQFRGRAIIDSYTKISGSKDFPKISSNVKLHEGSALTITRPKEKIKNVDSRGVVIFVNRNDTLNPILTKIKEDTSAVTSSGIKGMDLSADIEINKNSSLTVIIDPASGDSLQVKGDATLNFSIDPSGKTSLTGRYEIAEGSYHLSFYDLVKRKFIFRQGSITWNGDPMSANVDLTAVYEVRTSPIDLVSDQLTGASDQEKNSYQQQLPFQLYMYMKGELMKPEITFSLDLPANERGALNGSVYAKINALNEDEAELNKQVFALLLLNRFVAEDPLQSSQNNDVQNVARNSVSQLLSQQLNRFAGNYIKGVQLNLNLQSYEDYSSGTAQGRTELQLGVSKQLLNDRLNVQVGGNVDLEGQKAKENSVSTIAGDVSAEYKLTPEGTYRLRFYRRNDYDILQGEIIETAFGLVFTKDYDRMRDLFKRSKETQENKNPDNTGVK